MNVAEGAGEFSRKDKSRFYRMARRSATECAAVLDVCRTLGLSRDELLVRGRALLIRVVSMLVPLARRTKRPGTGTGTGTGTKTMAPPAFQDRA